MKTPSYSWSCHKCQSVNEPGRPICKECGFPAFASGREISPPRPHESVVEMHNSVDGHWLANPSSFMLFFPEAIPAWVAVLASPFWFISLVVSGQLLAALILLIGQAVGLYFGYVGFQSKSRTIVYGAMLVILVTTVATFSASDAK